MFSARNPGRDLNTRINVRFKMGGGRNPLGLNKGLKEMTIGIFGEDKLTADSFDFVIQVVQHVTPVPCSIAQPCNG